MLPLALALGLALAIMRHRFIMVFTMRDRAARLEDVNLGKRGGRGGGESIRGVREVGREGSKKEISEVGRG